MHKTMSMERGEEKKQLALRTLGQAGVLQLVSSFLGDPSLPLSQAVQELGCNPTLDRACGGDEVLTGVALAGCSAEAWEGVRYSVFRHLPTCQMLRRCTPDALEKVAREFNFIETTKGDAREMFRFMTGSKDLEEWDADALCNPRHVPKFVVAAFPDIDFFGFLDHQQSTSPPLPLDYLSLFHLFGQACRYGNVALVRTISSSPYFKGVTKETPEMREHVLIDAARNGHVEVVRLLRSDKIPAKFPWSHYTMDWIRANRVGVIRVLRSAEAADPDGERCPWPGNILADALRKLDTEMIGFLRSDEMETDGGGRFPWDSYELRVAVKEGTLKAVQMLRGGELGGKCPWDEDTLHEAARSGRWDCVSFLRSEEAADPDGTRCPWDERTLLSAIHHENYDMVRFLRSDKAAGPDGKWCPMSAKTIEAAVRCRETRIVRFLASAEARQKDEPVFAPKPYHMNYAVYSNNLKLIKLFRSDAGGWVPWDHSALVLAASSGSPEMVEFILSDEAVGPDGRRCPITEECVAAARRSGRSRIVRMMYRALPERARQTKRVRRMVKTQPTLSWAKRGGPAAPPLSKRN